MYDDLYGENKTCESFGIHMDICKNYLDLHLSVTPETSVLFFVNQCAVKVVCHLAAALGNNTSLAPTTIHPLCFLSFCTVSVQYSCKLTHGVSWSELKVTSPT